MRRDPEEVSSIGDTNRLKVLGDLWYRLMFGLYENSDDRVGSQGARRTHLT